MATVTLPERCYSMDTVYPLMVVATAERHIQIYNLTNPSQPYKVLSSYLIRHCGPSKLIVDHHISFEMANTRCNLLQSISSQRLRSWKCRRPSGFPLRRGERPVVSLLRLLYFIALLVCLCWIETTETTFPSDVIGKTARQIRRIRQWYLLLTTFHSILYKEHSQLQVSCCISLGIQQCWAQFIHLGADGSFHFWDKDARSRLKST